MRSVVLALALAGCATSPASVALEPVGQTIQSAKPPEAFARCFADNLPGQIGVLRQEPDGHWLVMITEPGRILHRWDFHATQGGSYAELRSAVPLSKFVSKVQNCV